MRQGNNYSLRNWIFFLCNLIVKKFLNFFRVPYQTFDILNDEDVRQGLKKYSNWPTYPQVYVKGELVGGLDIIQELHKNGELMSILQPK